MIDYLIVTNIPVFYKINLYNEISKRRNLYVLFIADNTEQKRSNDFIGLQNATFKYECLNLGSFESRNKLKSLILLFNAIKLLSFKKIIISGWDLPEFWLIAFLVKKEKNCFALESTLHESKTNGLKGIVKKIFISRISKVFATGNAHLALLQKLGYKRKYCLTQGVGIINKPVINIRPKKSLSRKFVFIGRLSPEKNLTDIISVFNNHINIELFIYGVGSLENTLKNIAKDNIKFMGSIANNQIEEVFYNTDFLILPSKSETWGLVVEESLYFGVPVVISESCGAAELIKNNLNGFVFSIGEFKIKLDSLLQDIENVVCNISKENSIDLINKKDENQVRCYLEQA